MVYFCFHRYSYIYVCHFSLARRWCTVPQVIRAMLILLAVAILHQSTRFFDRKFLPIKYVLDEKIFEGCEYHTSEWVSVIFYFIYLYIYLSFICHRTNKKIYFIKFLITLNHIYEYFIFLDYSMMMIQKKNLYRYLLFIYNHFR